METVDRSSAGVASLSCAAVNDFNRRASHKLLSGLGARGFFWLARKCVLVETRRNGRADREAAGMQKVDQPMQPTRPDGAPFRPAPYRRRRSLPGRWMKLKRMLLVTSCVDE